MFMVTVLILIFGSVSLVFLVYNSSVNVLSDIKRAVGVETSLLPAVSDTVWMHSVFLSRPHQINAA